jgi:hypothetical protein
MPSDHFASASMPAMLLAEQDPRLGVLGWSYAMLLGVALVYLGEHYVLDLFAGLALAALVVRARRPLSVWLMRCCDSVPEADRGQAICRTAAAGIAGITVARHDALTTALIWWPVGIVLAALYFTFSYACSAAPGAARRLAKSNNVRSQAVRGVVRQPT